MERIIAIGNAVDGQTWVKGYCVGQVWGGGKGQSALTIRLSLCCLLSSERKGKLVRPLKQCAASLKRGRRLVATSSLNNTGDGGAKCQGCSLVLLCFIVSFSKEERRA